MSIATLNRKAIGQLVKVFDMFNMYRTNLNTIGDLMQTKTKVLLYLILLAVTDTIIPIPITGMILIYVLYQKPDWFRELVEEIYGR